jgi:hypothetical protein
MRILDHSSINLPVLNVNLSEPDAGSLRVVKGGPREAIIEVRLGKRMMHARLLDRAMIERTIALLQGCIESESETK